MLEDIQSVLKGNVKRICAPGKYRVFWDGPKLIIEFLGNAPKQQAS